MGIVFDAYELTIHGDSVVAPWPDDDYDVQPKDRGCILVETPLLGPWMLRASCVFDRALNDQRAHTILRGRERGDDLIRQPPKQYPPIPLGGS